MKKSILHQNNHRLCRKRMKGGQLEAGALSPILTRSSLGDTEAIDRLRT
jgi:hypothetical protein